MTKHALSNFDFFSKDNDFYFYFKRRIHERSSPRKKPRAPDQKMNCTSKSIRSRPSSESSVPHFYRQKFVLRFFVFLQIIIFQCHKSATVFERAEPSPLSLFGRKKSRFAPQQPKKMNNLQTQCANARSTHALCLKIKVKLFSPFAPRPLFYL